MKVVCVLCLVCLLCFPAAAKPAHDERAFSLPAALVNELETWVEHTDFWRLVLRAEIVLANVEINESASKRPEAWLCGVNTICVTAGLRQLLSHEELRAAIAHEAAHIVIPRPKRGHAQLWELQCDLLAAALLRDAEPVRNMLFAVDRVCSKCRDAEHPAPQERIALLDHCAELPLEKMNRLDSLRAGSFTLPQLSFDWLKIR